MKKLLVVLMVVAVVSFLFVGCIPIIPDPDDPVDPDEPIGICPVVEVTSEVAVEGKKYIGIGKQTITVTFAVPTEPVSVYVGSDLKNNGYIPGHEVVMYPNDDKTIYTGDFVFGEEIEKDCSEAYIYVETCETCAYCKYPYTVDKVAPYASIEITDVVDCYPDISMKFNSAWVVENGDCDPVGGCCGDACSGLASWKIDIYDRDPYKDCCAEDPCAKIFDSGEGIACPVLWVTDCTDEWFLGVFYVIVELKDVVGNSTKYYARLTFGGSTLTSIEELTLGEFCDWSVIGNSGELGSLIIGDPCL